MPSHCPQCGTSISSKTEAFDSTIAAEPGTIARYLKLMRTNEPPASPEITYIQAVVSKTSARLARLDEDISQLRACLKEREDERKVLAESHEQNTAILSPLRRMPPEVLTEIFLWTLPLPYDFEACGLVSMKMKLSPWILGQISSRWRKIALSTPSLWSLVYISSERRANSLPMIQTQVQRAQKLKIHVDASNAGSTTTLIEQFEFLSEHSARWEELDIWLTAALVPRLAVLRGRIPSLRRLWVRGDAVKSQTAIDSLKCFETATFLMALRLDVGSRFLPTFFPAHRLTFYRVRCPWQGHQEILRMAPNIVQARVTVPSNCHSPWPEPDGKVIELPHLRRLLVSPPNILDHFRAPALTGIGIYTQLKRDRRLPHELDGFLVRSSCAPRRLCLEGWLDVNITTDILKRHCSITSVVFVFSRGSQQEFTNAVDTHSITLTHKDVPVFAHLQEIYFATRTMPAFPINYSLFLNMLQSRWTRDPQRTLNAAGYLTMQSGPSPDPVTLAGLNVLSGTERGWPESVDGIGDYGCTKAFRRVDVRGSVDAVTSFAVLTRVYTHGSGCTVDPQLRGRQWEQSRLYNSVASKESS